MKLFVAALAAAVAGAINAVAGGGTLLTFPALLAAGVLPVEANATSTVALVTGSFSAFWGYRREGRHRLAEGLWFGVPSVAGGLLGAWLLVRVNEALFSRMVPWLLFGATGLFMVQGRLQRWRRLAPTEGAATDAEPRLGSWLGVALFQFFVAAYGGFFGAGIGILMLAAMGILGLHDIHQMNRLKNFAAVCINGVAAVTFVAGRKVVWPFALVMAAASILGGYSGAGLARRLGPRNVRRLVEVIGLSIGLYTLLRPL